MRKIEQFGLAFFLTGLCFTGNAQNTPQGVSIAPDQVPPSKNAMLDVVATEKGMLIPRVTKSVLETGGALEPGEIISGEDGLLVFVTDNTSDYGYWYFDAISGDWVQFGTGSGSGNYIWTENSLVPGGIYYGDGSTNSVSVLVNADPDPGVTPSLGVYPVQIHTVYDQAAVADNPAPGSMTIGGMATTKSSITTGHGNEINFNGSSLDLQFWNGGAVHIGSNITNADLEVYGDIISNGGSIYSVSDSTLKINIHPTANTIATPQLRDKFKNLKTYSYNYKSDPGVKRYGVLAQEISTLFPDAVTTYQRTIGKDAAGGNQTQAVMVVDYTALSVFSLEMVKELVVENENQETRIATLEEQVQNLLERVAALEQ